MRVFEGETQPTLNSITEAVAYDKLANGEDIFGRFHYKEHVDFILSLSPTCIEALNSSSLALS